MQIGIRRIYILKYQLEYNDEIDHSLNCDVQMSDILRTMLQQIDKNIFAPEAI